MFVADRAAAWADLLARLLDRALDVDVESHTLAHGGAVPVDAADVVVLGDDEGADGLVERVAGIRATHPACRILVLADGANRSRVRSIRRAGADRVVARDASADDFISVVRVLLGGRHVAAVGRAVQPPHGTGPRGAALTAAETRVLFLLAAGRSNEEIASSLGITLNTVRTHVQRVTGKLGADSRLRAVALARECGALDRVSAAGGRGS